jgi:hypothetical protein
MIAPSQSLSPQASCALPLNPAATRRREAPASVRTEQNVIGNGSFFSTKGKILTPIGTICFTIDAIPAPPQSHSTVFRRRKPSENKPFNPVFGSKCPEFAWSAPAAPKAES